MSLKDPMQQAEVEKLVAASKRGDSNAFGKIYDLYLQPVYRYVYYRVGKDEAEDLTELIFLKVWENIKQYKPSESTARARSEVNDPASPAVSRAGLTNKTFSSWIFRIAHNVVIDYYRSNHFESELHENFTDERLEAQTQHRSHRHFDQSILSEALKGLKDHYRQIIILKYINDLSYEEIGHIMGRSQAALRILQFRALKSLRNFLETKGISGFDV